LQQLYRIHMTFTDFG